MILVVQECTATASTTSEVQGFFEIHRQMLAKNWSSRNCRKTYPQSSAKIHETAMNSPFPRTQCWLECLQA